MTEELSEPDVFVLLSERRRRLALRILRDSTEPLRLVELAERICDRECERPSPADIRGVSLTLHHNHVPRLADADVVAYDRAEGWVRLDRNFDVLDAALQGVTDRDLPWSE